MEAKMTQGSQIGTREDRFIDSNFGVMLQFKLNMKPRKPSVATCLALLFVVGVLIVPALHEAHCAACHDMHDSDHCPICQVACTPLVIAVPQIEPVAHALVIIPIHIPQLQIPSAPISRTAQARGPPPS